MANKKGGIYTITHIESGRLYVGSSLDIYNRWRGHRYALRKNKHHSDKLQKAWNKYGEATFVFSIVESVELPGPILQREQHYLDSLKPFFNLAPTANRTIVSEATRQKLSNLQRSRSTEISKQATGRKHTEETRKKMSEAAKDRDPLCYQKGRDTRMLNGSYKPSAETRQKMSEAHKGVPLAPETVSKIVAANKGKTISEEQKTFLRQFFTGRHISEETRRKMSLAAKARKRKQVKVNTDIVR